MDFVFPKEDQDLSSLVEELQERYGHDLLRQTIVEYTEKTDELSEYNRRLMELDEKAHPDQYDSLVRRIMEVTRDYYDFVGDLPEDLRRLFWRLSSASFVEDASWVQEVQEKYDLQLQRATGSLPMFHIVRPRSYIMQLDTITNQLPTLGNYQELKVGSQGKQPVTTAVTLDIPEHMQLEGGEALTTYDKSILNGVTSLLECGNTVFSIPMLYHAMTGKQNPTVDDQLAEELSAKLEKMRRMMLTIDLSRESRAQFLTDADGQPLKIEQLLIEGYLIPLNKMTGVINGKKAELFQLVGTPPLYTYSKMKRQLASVPIALLSAPVNNNSTTIPLKTYLLQRIELMKNPSNSIRSRVILYDTVYRELGDSDSNKTRKKRIRAYANAILGHFIQEGYITGYQEFKKGRSIAGIRVEF